MIPDDVASEAIDFGLKFMVAQIEERLHEEDEWDATQFFLLYRGIIDPDQVELDEDEVPEGPELRSVMGMGMAWADLGPAPEIPTHEALDWYADDLRAGGQRAWVTEIADQIPPGAIVTAVLAVYQARAVLPPSDLDGLTNAQAHANVDAAPDLAEHPWTHDMRYVVGVDNDGHVAACQRVRGIEGSLAGFSGTMAAAAEGDVPGVEPLAHFLDAALDRLLALETA